MQMLLYLSTMKGKPDNSGFEIPYASYICTEDGLA